MELLNNDVAGEILCRLPAKDLMSLRCTAKRWNDLISDPSFLHLHSQRSEVVSGLFVQETIPEMDLDFELVNYISVGKEQGVVQDKLLNFLPEKVVLMGTSGGLLCCRSCIYEQSDEFKRSPHMARICTRKENCQNRLVIYICNPATRQWTSLGPEGCPASDVFGLALCPFNSSSNSFPNFKLVSILHSEVSNAYSFSIYSSETRSWKTSKEVCYFSSNILANRMVFVNGRFHWLTIDHHVITFHVEQELSQVIKLPGLTPLESNRCRVGICLGQSGGQFYYICALLSEIQVWLLEDYNVPCWIMKHCLPLIELYNKLPRTVNASYFISCRADERHFNSDLKPLTFYNDVLYLMSYKSLFSYNFDSGEVFNHCGTEQLGYHFRRNPTVLFYCSSLVSLHEFAVSRSSLDNKDS